MTSIIVRRRRFLRTAAWAVPLWAALGAATGYLTAGPAAAVWLAVVFGVLLVIVLGALYRLAARGPR